MVLKLIALGFLILGFVCLPLWPYSRNWSFYPMGYCFFVAVLTLLVSVFARRGSKVWLPGGRRPPHS